MNFNIKLQKKLEKLRNKLKEQTKRYDGRMNVICTDEALINMVKYLPRTLEDLEKIKGIGKTFVDNYGEEFIKEILKEIGNDSNKSKMNSNVTNIMKDLEKKLVNINKKNRLLSLNSIKAKYSFDLSYLGDKFLHRLLFNKSKVTLCDININTSINNRLNEEIKLKKLVSLLREANIDLREKGQNDLYVGYPFVIGRLTGEDFDVHAPLCLFPVIEERTPEKVVIYLDESRDIIYNNNLLLAYYKFNNINKPLKTEEIDVKNKEELFVNILSFYYENGITIINNNSGLSQFNEYNNKTFPHFTKGELYLEDSAILGRFPICSSSIQRDFEKMIDNNVSSKLVNDLLDNVETSNFDNFKNEVKEKDIVYVNELNSSQEKVLELLNNTSELVIKGPPGTGKSQTIVSLIANSVYHNKNVLMVSEKKTALDVVYSRLGDLSRYAILIDDVSNKKLFYDQLSKLTNLNKNNFYNNNDIFKISSNIEDDVTKLSKISSILYKKNSFGIEPYKLYLITKKYDYNNKQDIYYYSNIKKIFEDYKLLIDLDYNLLLSTKELFDDRYSLNKMINYLNIDLTFFFYKSIKTSLTSFELVELKERLNNLIKMVNEWKSKFFIIRLFTKGKIKREIDSIINTYFNATSKELKDTLFNNTNYILNELDKYNEYCEGLTLFNKLNDLEKNYLFIMYQMKDTLKIDNNDLNNQLYNSVLFYQIDKFEKDNRDVLININNFEDITKRISKNIKNKLLQSKQDVDNILYMEIIELYHSKRFNELKRVIESKRKYSVNKFVNKFGFELFKFVKIWLLTPEVVSEILPLESGLFDLVIFDEASQMYVEKGIPSIFRGKKVVVAGDDKQLRPSSLGSGRTSFDIDDYDEDDEIDVVVEEDSLLDLARFKYDDVLLNFHYRSKYEELIAFSNYAFYEGKLNVAPNTIKPIYPPIEVHKLDEALWENRSNRKEAEYVVRILKDFFNDRRNNETIGIITFNSSQRNLILDLIDEECKIDSDFREKVTAEFNRKKDGEDIGLFVKNIETVQGDERDHIIFSIGYAQNDKGKVVARFGWLNQRAGENRLNVAISRAKEKIEIVTSIYPYELEVENSLHDGPKYFKKYLEYAFAISDEDYDYAKEILNSFSHDKANVITSDENKGFINELYNELIKRGYDAYKNIGIGGYNIDLAIKKKDVYVLGIECDYNTYELDTLTRERDIHKSKYLERRGWKVHRVFSPNWWKNKVNEIKIVCNIIDNIK